MRASADTQIGFLRDCLAEAENPAYDDPDRPYVVTMFRELLRTVIAARDLYDNRADGDPKWLSELFEAIRPTKDIAHKSG